VRIDPDEVMPMTRALQALFLVVGLAAATPALAQSRGYYGGPPRARAYPDNALRLQIGGASLGTEDCAGGPCFANTRWGALVFGADFDLALGGPINLTLGAREVSASSFSGNPSIFEPAAGLTFKFGRHTPVEPRLGAGLALLFASNGDNGAALRLGGGLSFFGYAPIGLALDLVFEVGQVGGVTISQAQFLIGPEFRF
jgi:hypothetical protein